MKYNKLFVAAALLVLPFATWAQSNKTTILHDGMDSLQIIYESGKWSVTNGESFATLTVEGCLPSVHVGRPDLPEFSQMIEVPLCGGFEVRLTNAVYDTVDAPHQPIMPVQPARRKNDTTTHPLVIDHALYNTDAYYGEAEVRVNPIGVARDRNLARLVVAPVRYNPVKGKMIICRRATVTVVYIGADAAATTDMYNRYHTPAFMPDANALNNLYPKSVNSSAPVRYLIVAHSMFNGQLDGFVQWKRRKGFMVDIVYTGAAGVGNTATSIANYVKSQYTNATAECPAPAYLLLVGDVQQIPEFSGQSDTSHATDLYYATWTTGDNVPDCYYGRFSAQNETHLLPQIEKTLMYEQYTFADPRFLDRAVMVAGVDAGRTNDNGYRYGDPSMDYAITNYVNGSNGFKQVKYFKNDLSIVPSATNVIMGGNGDENTEYIRNCYSDGAGLINYTAHGGVTCWADPYLGTENVPQMTNYQKFGLMIGNCCQSNTFNKDVCLGEALLRRGDYCGAVGYIGASNNSYWTYDFYWSIGSRNTIGPNMSMAYNANKIGAYDRLFHTHYESYASWATTQGAIVMGGNLAVMSHPNTDDLYYWEIYHLMGDPSVMPYLTQANVMELAMQPVIARGTASLQVQAVPYAYVAITDTADHTLHASAFADATGLATLTLPSDLAVGSYELAASAQQYRVAFRKIQVVDPDSDACLFAASATADTMVVAGAATPLTVQVQNIGNAGSDATVRFTCSDPRVTFTTGRVSVYNVAAGTTATVNAATDVVCSQQIADGTEVTVVATVTTPDGQSTATEFPLYVYAPNLEIAYSGMTLTALPGASDTLEVHIDNYGHAALPSSRLVLQASTSLVSATCLEGPSFTVAAGDQVTLHYRLQTDSRMPAGVVVPVKVSLADFYNNIDDTLLVYSTATATETFENGVFHTTGWTNGNYPWQFTAAVSDAGLWSLRSNSSLTDNQTSEISIVCTVTQPDTIRFRYKILSERNYDKFRLYVDNTKVFDVSGHIDWATAAIPVSQGGHTLRFAYEKDYSRSDSLDCVWIDNLMLPAVTIPAMFRHEFPCEGSVYVYGGDTVDLVSNPTGVFIDSTADTLTIIDYSVSPVYNIDTAVTVCESYTFGGQEYTASCDVAYTFASIHGCDSTVTLHLTVSEAACDTADAGIAASAGDGTIQVSVYPNPTTGQVRLGREVEVAEVYDLCGRRLLRREHVDNLDLGPLPTGVYTFRLTLTEGSTVCRVMKQ